MKIRSFLVVLFLVLGVLYSVLSRYSHVNSDGAGMSFCIFGVATLVGLMGQVFCMFVENSLQIIALYV